MTREEAIKRIETIKHCDVDEVAKIKALDMAIAALREQSRPESSNQQVTEPLQRNGFSGSDEAPASKNQVKGIRLMARPWQPQDLLDDLQLMIDEEPDSYLNDRRTTLCMARDFLKELFAESGWISVEDRLPTVDEEDNGLVGIVNGYNGRITFTDAVIFLRYDFDEKVWWSEDYALEGCKVTHWMPLPEPPEVPHAD